MGKSKTGDRKKQRIMLIALSKSFFVNGLNKVKVEKPDLNNGKTQEFPPTR